MALTRPTFNNINSNTLARFNDPLVVLNAANASPNNQDIGFIFNRGSSGNVAMSWNETIDAFTLVYTSSTGQVDGNVTATGNANLQLGNLTTVGASSFTGNMTVRHILPAANVTYDLGSPTQRFRTLYVGANTIDIGGATISSNATSIIFTNPAGGSFSVGSASPTIIASVVNATTIGNTGATIVGTTANISGNATVVGNLTTNNVLATGYFYANGLPFSGGSGYPGGSSGQIQFNNSGSFAGATGITTNGTNLTVTGGIQNAPIGNVTANTGAFTTLTATGAFTGTTVNAAAIGNTGATLTGTLQTASQTNITGVGNITTGTWNGTAIALNKLAASTISGVSLGNNLNTLTLGSYLTGTSYNGSSAVTAAVDATSANTVSKVVARDASGNFSAGTITATLSGTASNAALVVVTDSRATATTPQTINQGVVFDFKQNTTEGLSDGGTYFAEMTFRQYGSATDWSGGLSHQLGFTDNGNIWQRSGSSTTWGSWKKLWDSSNLTNLNQLTNGPGYTTNTGTVTSVSGSGSASGLTLSGTVSTTGNLTLSGTVNSLAAGTYSINISGSAGSATTSTTATNLAGGGAGQIPYQTAAGTTAMLAAGTAGYVLTSNGTSAPSWAVAPATGLKYTTANAAPSAPSSGDFWYDTTANILYQRINNGITSAWVDQSTTPTTFSTLTVTSNATVNTSLRVNSNNNVTAIVNLGTNGTGNIGAAGATFNTVFAKATTAQYADLAENYLADAVYTPGTVVVFGGEQEITVSDTSHDSRVAGVISTNPGFLMNEGQSSGLPVAFTGRVPCQVQGPVCKGDVLVNVSKGVAGKLDASYYTPGCVIGKSLEDIPNFEIKTIEVVVGRF